MNYQFTSYFFNILQFNQPSAIAHITGANDHPDLCGSVLFYEALDGMLILTQIMGLPYTSSECSPRFLGFHIHAGAECTGNAEDPFANAGLHLNPYNCPHPMHMGDLPPLLVNEGIAWSVVYSHYLKPDDIVNRTVIIHSMPDDFTSQPAGNSGKKIGCGKIQPIYSVTDSILP